MEEPFKSVISAANRSNVSFYAVDARGLTTGSASSGAMNTLNRAARASQDQMANDGSQAVRPDEAKLYDTSSESTRANTQNTLANLAESTGGMLIANTNDVGTPLRKLAEDIQTYYEIGYVPEIKSYDGSFRKIAIKMNSSDLRVQSRSGYIAPLNSKRSEEEPRRRAARCLDRRVRDAERCIQILIGRANCSNSLLLRF